MILGVAAYHHGCGAVMLRGGNVIAMAEEPGLPGERFPGNALRECFLQAGASPADIDLVTFAGKPRAEFADAFRRAPSSPGRFVNAMRPWLERRLHVVAALEDTLGHDYSGRCVFVAGTGDAREAAFTARHDVLGFPRQGAVVDRATTPTPSSYFSQSIAGVPITAPARALAWAAGLIIRRAGGAGPRRRRRQDDTVPDEIYTLW
jgi:hypothetical protein